MTIEWTTPGPPRYLAGDEAFTGMPGKVADFWRFALGDLRMNNARGYFAEYLVARALEIPDPRRVEWDAYDVRYGAISIEVKCSAHLQAWEQKSASQLSFSGLRARTWTPRAGESAEATYNGDVYVFCVETARTHDAYDPLDLSQWQFAVLSRTRVAATGYRSITWPTVIKIAGGEQLAWHDLREAITRAAAENVAHDPDTES
jgi:hypothetical protein